jgi:hypothetical protein
MILRNVILKKLYGSLLGYWTSLQSRGTRLQKALLEAGEDQSEVLPLPHSTGPDLIPPPPKAISPSLMDSILSASEKKKETGK